MPCGFNSSPRPLVCCSAHVFYIFVPHLFILLVFSVSSILHPLSALQCVLLFLLFSLWLLINLPTCSTFFPLYKPSAMTFLSVLHLYLIPPAQSFLLINSKDWLIDSFVSPQLQDLFHHTSISPLFSPLQLVNQQNYHRAWHTYRVKVSPENRNKCHVVIGGNFTYQSRGVLPYNANVILHCVLFAVTKSNPLYL